MSNDSTLYSPALRMKAGELAGLHALTPDIADRVLPRMVVPPPAERNILQGELFLKDGAPNITRQLSQYWMARPVFIEITHLIGEFGRDKMSSWLPKMFDHARQANLKPIPFLRLNRLCGTDIDAFRAAIDRAMSLKIGICVDESDLIDAGLHDALTSVMDCLAVRPDECAMVADLSEADFSNTEVAALVVRANLQNLQELDQWHWLIFQGTHYPDKNPAHHGSHELWPRNEWIAWRKAVGFCRTTPRYLVFGDYAADCSKMAFGSSRAQAIRHYRYTTESEAWLIERAVAMGSDRERMREVCNKIITSGHYDGPGFSFADEFIFKTAKESGNPGNSTTWRQINTNRHITRVVVDIARVREIDIRSRGFMPADTQNSFL